MRCGNGVGNFSFPGGPAGSYRPFVLDVARTVGEAGPGLVRVGEHMVRPTTRTAPRATGYSKPIPPGGSWQPGPAGAAFAESGIDLGDFEPHHYAFMVSDQEFDVAFARIQGAGTTCYGDPACQEEGDIYRSKRHEGRRGTYFRDPNGHLLEILAPGA